LHTNVSQYTFMQGCKEEEDKDTAHCFWTVTQTHTSEKLCPMLVTVTKNRHRMTTQSGLTINSVDVVYL